MAPVIKWQRFEAAAYDWNDKTATGALPQIEAELDAWIAAVNGNTSNAGRQVIKEKGYADAILTTSDFQGIVISCNANNNTEKSTMMFIAQTTLKRMYTGVWTDSTSNNGYGTIDSSGGGWSDTSMSWVSSAVDIDFIIMSDTTDEKEFFVFGINYVNSTNYEGWAIWKAENGEWVMEWNDNANGGVQHYWTDPSGPTGWNNGERTSTSNSTVFYIANGEIFERRNFIATTYTTWDPFLYPTGGTIVAANEYLLQGLNTYGGRVYAWTDISATREVYKIFSYSYGPAVYVDARP